MDGSTTSLPSDLFEFSVLHDHRHGGISTGEFEHLFTELHIVLGVEVFESDAALGVILTRLLTIWTAGFRVYFDFQAFSPFLLLAGTQTPPVV